MSGKERKVPVEELTAYERWELPQIGGGDPAMARARASIKKAVKPLTAEDLEKIRQEAYQAGFEEGKQAGFEQGQKEGHVQGKQAGQQEGFNQGLQDGKVHIDQAVAQLRQCMQQLTQPIAEQQQLVEQAMMNVALAIARAVIHRELSLDSSQVAHTVNQAIHNLPDLAAGIKVHMNATDIEHARASIEGLDTAIEIIQNTSLQPGGCLVETSSQLIDYTIEKRFQKTVHSMLFEAANAGAHTSLETSTSINELSDYSAETLEEAEQELKQSDSDASLPHSNGEPDEPV